MEYFTEEIVHVFWLVFYFGIVFNLFYKPYRKGQQQKKKKKKNVNVHECC